MGWDKMNLRLSSLDSLSGRWAGPPLLPCPLHIVSVMEVHGHRC